MTNKDFFQNNIHPSCEYCLYLDSKTQSCSKNKKSKKSEKCGSFEYYPIKRTPKKTPKLPSYSIEEFTL